MDGLLFDMGDVLYDATLWRRWLWKQVGRIGCRSNYVDFWRMWDLEFLVHVHCGRRDYQEAFESFLAVQGLSTGAVGELLEASRFQKKKLEAEMKPLIGVPRALERLKAAGLRMAVVTDSESTSGHVAERLVRMGFGGLFSVVVSSRDLHASKPDPVCYFAALDGLGLTPDQAGFVGHDEDELVGAAQVGLRTIAFNAPADVPSDYRIRRFDDLPDLVSGLSQTRRRCA